MLIFYSILYDSDEEIEDADALLYLQVSPEIDEPEEGWPLSTDNVSILFILIFMGEGEKLIE